MIVIKEASARRSIQVEVGVPGTPREAWQASATGPGISSWFVPAEFDKRNGKLALNLRALLTALVLLLLLPSSQAQEPPKPGKEHEHLKQLVGTWDAETEFGNGTMTYKMGLGGLWLIGDFEGEFGGMKFQGKGLDTYDSATKKYRSVWADSFSTGPRLMEGTWDKDNKVMTMTGEGPAQEGKTARFKSITELKDADTLNFSLFILDKDGKELPMVKITYKRKSEHARRPSSLPGAHARRVAVAHPLQ
jgi:hypothetical protein